MAEAGVLKGAQAKPHSRMTAWTYARPWLRRLVLLILAVVFVPYLIVPLYAVVNPPVTVFMLERAAADWNGIHKKWVDLDQISPHLARAVLAAEDARFCSHHGIDWIEVQNAFEDSRSRRGASTITMQVARGLFFLEWRSWVRKAFEAPLALYTDFILPKRRILEIYLNIVEWGPGVYGTAEVSERSFGVPPSKLSKSQAALLAAALPAPLQRDAAKPSRGMSRIARRIAGRAARLGPAADCVLKR